MAYAPVDATVGELRTEAEARAEAAGWALVRVSDRSSEGTKIVDGAGIDVSIYENTADADRVILLLRHH